MDTLDYIYYVLINLTLLTIFIISGKNISDGKNYTINSLCCIIVYTFVLGLRYDRGLDYQHYADIYQNGYDEGVQVVFSIINSTLKLFGIGKYQVFLIYSFIEILCAFIFLKKYKNLGIYIIPFFMIATIEYNEDVIRQALGFSFAFICLSKIMDLFNRDFITIKNILIIFLLFAISYSIHSACGYILIIIILIAFFIKKAIPLIVSIPLLFFSAYFFESLFDYSLFSNITFLFAGDERMSEYVSRFDMWFTQDAQEEMFARKSYILIFELLGTSSLFYLGREAIQHYNNHREAIAFYNVFVIGTILLNCFRKLELVHRIAQNLSLFWFFPLSLVLYYRKTIIKSSKEWAMYCLLVWWVYDYLKYLFLRESIQFIWNI